jgi:metacaspase-1
MPKGISLHIGLNHVDATAYGGWDGALAAAVHDAHDMALLASSEGYRTQLLSDRQATATAVLTAIRTAGGKLRPGDVFMLSYSGHGGQLTDVAPDGEPDGLDETWVCWDRQLLDDEVYAALASFTRDVRVIVVADTTHCGTTARSALAPSPPVRTPEGARRARIIPAAVSNADQSRRHGLYQRIRRSSRAEIRRAMARQRALTRRQAGLRKPTNCLSARAVLLTACQDNEVAYDGPGNGAFTNALLTTWVNGRFDGTYRDFVSLIRTRLSAQTPGLLSVGRGASGWEASRPFTIDIRHDLELVEDPGAQPD